MIKSRVIAFKYAFRGFFLMFKEPPFQVQVAVVIMVTVAGSYFNISSTEWLIQIILCGLVLVAETLNTAIEKSFDRAGEDFHPITEKGKDIAAGAVLIATLIAIIGGLIIYLPKIF